MKTEAQLPLTDDEIRKLVRESRKEQGLPEHIEDPSTLAKVVALLGETEMTHEVS